MNIPHENYPFLNFQVEFIHLVLAWRVLTQITACSFTTGPIFFYAINPIATSINDFFPRSFVRMVVQQ